MRGWIVVSTLLAWCWASSPGALRAAEVTEVCDAADGDDPFDIDIDVTFHSLYNRSQIAREYWPLWDATRSDISQLDFKRVVYDMVYKVEIGLYHDVALYIDLPWIIQDKREIKKKDGLGTLWTPDPANPPAQLTGAYPGNALAEDPAGHPSSTRAGIGDMHLGVKWAAFSDERDDTKSQFVIGLEYTIPSGSLYRPEQIINGNEGEVGMGHHILTPFFLFSHRFSILDPYIGLNGSVPFQSKAAKDAGLKLPYYGGFLAGTEVVPWESKDGMQKFSIDIGLWTTFFTEVDSKGKSSQRGVPSEVSDFLVAADGTGRQLQYTGQYAQFGAKLAFQFKAHEYFRFQMGVSLAHNTEHFVTGADPCRDGNGDGTCSADHTVDPPNPYYSSVYDFPGFRLRVEETTLLQWWITLMATF
ncbi:MAG TPA: hypothetical protein PK668_23485 [Myxococcota bacterium]|nr:hypothetical protein [Myxococcota bacterium]HRY96487.1 hypothetical protein [Myxococcota bacterium]